MILSSEVKKELDPSGLHQAELRLITGEDTIVYALTAGRTETEQPLYSNALGRNQDVSGSQLLKDRPGKANRLQLSPGGVSAHMRKIPPHNDLILSRL